MTVSQKSSSMDFASSIFFQKLCNFRDPSKTLSVALKYSDHLTFILNNSNHYRQVAEHYLFLRSFYNLLRRSIAIDLVTMIFREAYHLLHSLHHFHQNYVQYVVLFSLNCFNELQHLWGEGLLGLHQFLNQEKLDSSFSRLSFQFGLALCPLGWLSFQSNSTVYCQTLSQIRFANLHYYFQEFHHVFQSLL